MYLLLTSISLCACNACEKRRNKIETRISGTDTFAPLSACFSPFERDGRTKVRPTPEAEADDEFIFFSPLVSCRKLRLLGRTRFFAPQKKMLGIFFCSAQNDT